MANLIFPIIGLPVTIRGLNLTCPVCAQTWRNIPATGHCVSHEDFPTLKIHLEGIDPEAVCLCLLEHLIANPVVILWPNQAADFN